MGCYQERYGSVLDVGFAGNDNYRMASLTCLEIEEFVESLQGIILYPD